MTKKEIVKKISEEIGLTQLKTKDIVQRTLDAIIQTLVSEGRIELRNFGVFEIKRRAPRKARNPRSADSFRVPAKNVVTFKPNKEMEDLVRQMNPDNLPLLEDESGGEPAGLYGPSSSQGALRAPEMASITGDEGAEPGRIAIAAEAVSATLAGDASRGDRSARVMAHAEEVFGDRDKALRWLERPNVALGDVAPLSLLDSERGARRVETILGRIEYGVHS